MRQAIAMMLVLFLAGCGSSRAKFDENFTSAYCDLVLACEDEAVLTFDGIETIGDCTSQIAPEVTTLGAECKFKRRNGKQCVNALADVTCAEEGGFAMPVECEEVFKKGECSANPEDEGASESDAQSDFSDREFLGELPVSPNGPIDRIRDLGSL